MSEKKPQPLTYAVTPANVRCLRCEKVFKSPDKRRIRLCERCRQRK